MNREDGIYNTLSPSFIFLKEYNPEKNNLREWDRKDAVAYLNNIKTNLIDFLK